MVRQPAADTKATGDWPSRDRTTDPLRIGQRVRLLRDSRAKFLWDRATYSAHVEAGAEGVVTGYELLDRDGYLTTDAIQELRGYPGTAAYEVASLVTRPGFDSPQEAWAYVTADDLAVVDARGRRAHPHGEEVERRLVEIEVEAVRPPPPIKVVGPKSWAKPRRRRGQAEEPAAATPEPAPAPVEAGPAPSALVAGGRVAVLDLVGHDVAGRRAQVRTLLYEGDRPLWRTLKTVEVRHQPAPRSGEPVEWVYWTWHPEPGSTREDFDCGYAGITAELARRDGHCIELAPLGTPAPTEPTTSQGGGPS